jgi:hypothetical protein
MEPSHEKEKERESSIFHFQVEKSIIVSHHFGQTKMAESFFNPLTQSNTNKS